MLVLIALVLLCTPLMAASVDTINPSGGSALGWLTLGGLVVGMAFSGEAVNLTKQRSEQSTRNASPGVQSSLRAFWSFMLGQKLGLNQLQMVSFDHTTNGSNGSNADTVICAGACTLYLVYYKKFTGAVESFLKISNHATAIQAAGQLIVDTIALAQEGLWQDYKGMTFATGATLATVTAYNGTTRSLLADSNDGFALIGA